ncbi:MAG: LptE family protein [Phycisphaeraceae bacterium]
MLMAWVVTVMLAGCGYSPQALYDDRYGTVAVPIFENRTFWERAQFDLTEAVVKEIEQRTPYKVVPAGVADTVLQGTITDVQQRQIARRRPTGVPEEMEITMTVDFEWNDLRTGETLRRRRGFEVVGRYVPTRPVGERYETAQHAAVAQLASDIVSTLRQEW